MVQDPKQYLFNSGVRVEISVLNDLEGTDKSIVGTITDKLLEDQK